MFFVDNSSYRLQTRIEAYFVGESTRMLELLNLGILCRNFLTKHF